MCVYVYVLIVKGDVQTRMTIDIYQNATLLNIMCIQSVSGNHTTLNSNRRVC